jgi:hypothetical protein
MKTEIEIRSEIDTAKNRLAEIEAEKVEVLQRREFDEYRDLQDESIVLMQKSITLYWVLENSEAAL